MQQPERTRIHVIGDDSSMGLYVAPMIPAELAAITWSDLEALVAIGREEDDTIEFKSSFKGGDDYTALRDNQKEHALDALAREAIAFLNTRGGDIVIGVAEASGAHPRAESLSPVQSPMETADRVARGLAALIEPAQTNLSVRGLPSPAGEETGVIIIRARPSLRAPHRSKRNRECYVRRGSESVPMAMDEIQDLTMYRNSVRQEQQALLDHQFADFLEGRSDQRHFGPKVFHIRAVLFPFAQTQILIDDAVLMAMGQRNPVLVRAGERPTQMDVAFRGLHARWRPMLRGKKLESFQERVGPDDADFQFSAKWVKENGIAAFEYAAHSNFDERGPVVHIDWITGFIAQVCANIAGLSTIVPTMLPAIVRIGLRVGDPLRLAIGEQMWRSQVNVPQGTQFFPDYPISDRTDLNEFFQQTQRDMLSYCGVDPEGPYSFETPLQ